MLTTLLKQTFQNGGQGKEEAKGPPSLKNDLNNVAGIDDVKD